MSTKKLSKTQQELFDAMKAGVVVHYMRYMGRLNPNAYFFRADSGKRCTQAVEGLIARGLAEKRKDDIVYLLEQDAP